ncbi:MAG: tetratricopeptide repeat protein, partial [Promethearchaeota archaeon]
MEYSIPNELSKVKQLKDEGKFTEALQIANELEKRDNLSLQEQYNCHHLKGSLLFEQGYMDDALKYAERAYKSAQQLKEELQIIDAILIKAKIFRYSDKFTKAFDTISEAEQILKTFDDYSKVEFKEKNAYILHLKSQIYMDTGDLNLALKYGEESLQLARELNNKRLIIDNNGTIGVIYHYKGENDTYLKYNRKRLKLAKELNDKQNIIGGLNNIGLALLDKGDFNQAKNYLKQSLELCEEINSFKTPIILESYCQLAIETDSIETAQECLDYVKRFDTPRYKENLLGYGDNLKNLIEARVLKLSPKVSDKIRARELFKKELEKPVFDSKIMALLNLCDSFLLELYETNNIKILDDITNYIQQILDFAKEKKSYKLLAEAYLFQAKLKLITFEFEETQQLLKQALHISEKYGYELLARQ